jgi:hypothetical protein
VSDTTNAAGPESGTATAHGPSEPFGSWEETRKWRFELTLAATPSARLRWLEDAIAMAHRSGALPRPR